MPGTFYKGGLRVMVVGAGLGGLMTGILLERAGIAYHIFERTESVSPFGSVLSLCSNILPVFQQLGLLGELRRISLPVNELNIYNRQLQEVAVLDQSEFLPRTGFETLVFSRPELHALLLAQIPKDKISFNKMILSIVQDDHYSSILCEDGTRYQAHLIVGADGAYSSVRKSIYEDLISRGELPVQDAEPMLSFCVGLLGVTEPLDGDEFPQLREKSSKFVSVTGENGEMWSYATLPGNRISWGTAHHYEPTPSDHTAFHSQWGPEATDGLIKKAKEFRLPMGGKLARLIEHTPRERISRAVFEEKMFETWYHGRVVLLGDACHKMTPGAGQGAVSAMQDAIVLVNCLNSLHQNHDMSSTPTSTIQDAFQDYKDQRFSRAKSQVCLSRSMSKVIFAMTRFHEAMRWVVMSLVPEWIRLQAFLNTLSYQPQATFLPLVIGNKDFKVLPQAKPKIYGKPDCFRMTGAFCL